MLHKKLGFILPARLLLKQQREEMLGLPRPSTLDAPMFAILDYNTDYFLRAVEKWIAAEHNLAILSVPTTRPVFRNAL